MMEHLTSSWARPRTTRRYLHPPKAERMFTLWAEGKLIFGEIEKGIDWRSYQYVSCSGLWLVHGDTDEQFDFHAVENRLPENGTPFHGLTYRCGGLLIELDSFCSIERKPTCFARLRVTNSGAEPIRFPLALLLRSGREKELVFASPDEYESYAPDVSVWKQASCTWHGGSDGKRFVLHDEDTFLTAEGGAFQWAETRGALRLPEDYAAGETAEYFFSFGKGTAAEFDYEQEEQLARAFWERELRRITKLPSGLQNNDEQLRIVQNLTVQLLQCFCYPVGENYLMARQGGLQRLIWPWESTPVLEALGRLGDFSDYIEPVLSMYFEVLQAPDGEICPAGEGWANITASALYSFAKYCMDVSRRFYWRYRDHAMAAFRWMCRTRRLTPKDGRFIEGLFPPLRASDWNQEYQGWMSTDIANVKGLLIFADASERFDDPDAKAVRTEAADYFASMRRAMARFTAEAGDSDVLRIPLTPDGDDAKLLAEFYPYFNFGKFTALGIVDDTDVERVYRYAQSADICRGDLYGHMPYPDGNQHIWYQSIPEYYWFLTWMRLGRYDRAHALLNGQLRYAMTAEYYMIERYADDDPYYVPWSPNASASGRTIIMLLELAAAKKD